MTFQIQSTIESKDAAALGPAKDARDYMSMLADQDLLIRNIAPPPEGSITFEIDGVPFSATHKCLNETESQVLIWGTLGYLPYSVANYEKRRDLISILQETTRLHKVKFGIDHEMKIIAMGKFALPKPLQPDYFLMPIISFMQEARPYIRLIGEYL